MDRPSILDLWSYHLYVYCFNEVNRRGIGNNNKAKKSFFRSIVEARTIIVLHHSERFPVHEIA